MFHEGVRKPDLVLGQKHRFDSENGRCGSIGQPLQIDEHVLAGEMAAPLHLWDRHRRQPRRHTSQASSRQTGCTRVGAGRSGAPVRNCVLFLVSAVTARVLGPHQSESQRLRQPGIRLPHRSQTRPDWLHEQSRFRLDVTEMGAEKKV